MRTSLFMTFLLISAIALGQKKQASFIRDRPVPARVVNDYGKFLLPAEKQYLEKKLIAYRKRSGNALVIITVPALTDTTNDTEYTIEDAALEYFNKWGIGDRKKNNGVLIFLCREPHGVRIQTGTGIEDLLTDGDCSSIIQDSIIPAFKEEQYFDGLKQGVAGIINTVDEAEENLKAMAISQAAQPGSGGSDEVIVTPLTSNYPIYTQPENNWVGGMVALIGVVTIIGFLFAIVRGISGYVSGSGSGRYNNTVYNGNDYQNNYFHHHRNNDDDDRSISSSSFFSSDSGSSSSSSSDSSSASGSFDGGSSSGGGASGSW